MYLKRLGKFSEEDWENYFYQFFLSEEEKLEVRQILTLPKKEGIESNFKRLRELEIINGIGPSSLLSVTRWFISWIFKGVKYEWHDIQYGIGGDSTDRYDADRGLYKYSKASIISSYLIWIANNSPITFPLVVLGLAIQYIIGLFCYLSVRLLGRFAFNFTNK